MNSEKIEKELRYILSDSQYVLFKDSVRQNYDFFKPGKALLETTIMFDNPNPMLTFYCKEIDGRLRLRTSVPSEPDLLLDGPSEVAEAMLTWKQRIPKFSDSEIRKEREIEVHFEAGESAAMLSLLTDVLRCPRVSSYERYRETLYTENVEIASDRFPYGHVVELELKSGKESLLTEIADLLKLSSMLCSRLSCDDLYRVLCDRAGIISKADILFSDKDMPQISDYINEISSYL